MARNTTLVKLLDMYRAACKLSLNPAHNAGDRNRQVQELQRAQEFLWEDFSWPLLRVERTIQLQAGQRYYEPPSDLHIDRIERVEVYFDTAYTPLQPGIENVHYTAYNSNLDQRQWPPQRWKLAEDEQIEIWPVPSENYDPVTTSGHVKIYGIRNLRALVEDTDRADIDDALIVGYAAAEYLAGKGDKSANLVLEKAKARYAKMRGSQTKRRVTKMFGVSVPDRKHARLPIAVYKTS